MPSREIAELFGLSIRLPAWDMYDVAGKLAAISTKWGDLWVTGDNLCYLRQDILDRFLTRKRLELIWAFWGAREIRLADEEYRRQTPKFKHWRKEFQQVCRYNNGRAVGGKASEHYA